MSVENVVPVLPVDDMLGAVAQWSAILGVAPTFVDGARWAQFDVAGRRVVLAGSDRIGDVPGVMLKVSDLATERDRLIKLGVHVEPIVEGAHELRCQARAPGGWPLVLYCARPKS